LKKLLSALLAVCILFSNAAAAVIFSDDFKTLSEDWTYSAVPAGKSDAAATGDGLSLWFKTSAEEGKAIAARTFAFEDTVLCISMTIKVSGTDAVNQRKISVQNSGTLNITELLNFKGSEVYAFGSSLIMNSITKNTPYQVCAAVNSNTKDAIIWIDGVKVFSGNIGSKWKSFDYSRLQLEFKNYTSPKISTSESGFVIGSLAVSGGGGTITSNPVNGSGFVSSTLTRTISLDFGGIMAPVMYNKSNYTLYENGAEKNFEIASEGGGAVITVTGGFADSSNYRLVIAKTADVFDNETGSAAEISFSTAPSGYVPPEISINNENTTTYEGKSIVITSAATSGSGIAKVVYTVNGEAAAEVDNGEGYPFVLERLEGTYIIGAVAFDTLGGYSAQDNVTITFIKNYLPTVSVEGITEGGSYTSSRLADLVISAQDEGGSIVKVEVYTGSNLYATLTDAPYTVDLSGIGKGWQSITVRATDNADTSSAVTYNILITGNLTLKTAYENNFESYKSDGGVIPTGGGVLFGDCKMVSSADYGKEHGTVAVMSTEGAAVDTKTASGSYMQLPTSTLTGRYILEMDVNVSKVADSFYLMLKQPGVSQLAMDVGFNNGNKIYLKGGPQGTVYYDYTYDTWYSIKYDINLSDHTYSFYVNDTAVATDFAIGNKTLTNVDVRLILSMKQEGEQAKMAFDNMKIVAIEQDPVISSVGYDSVSECTIVSPYAKKIMLNLTAKLAADSVNKDTVKLYIGDEEILVSDAVYSENKITITPLEKIRSNETYRAVVTNDAQMPSGKTLDEELKIDFNTDFFDVDAEDVQIITSGEKAYAAGSIINRLGTEKTIYIVLSIWENRQLKDMTIKEIILTGNTSFRTDYAAKTSNQSAEVYIWDSVTEPLSVTSKIY